MKINKKLLALLPLSLMTVSLLSCSGDNYNTTIPYGTLASKLTSTVATANDDLSLSLDMYYTRLRASGYDVFETAVKKALYEKEYKAYKDMLNAKTINELTDKDATIEALTITNTTTNETLYTIDADKYLELRQTFLESINTSLASAIFSTGKEETINNNTEKENNKLIAKFVDAENKLGIEFTASDIKWFGKSSANYELGENSGLIQFESSTLTKLEDLINSYILTEAEKLSVKKGLFQVADLEYVYDEDKEDDTSNQYYLFDSDDIKTKYESTYMTYGTYRAIVIQFNTLKEAQDALTNITATGKISSDPATAKAEYINLYNSYYAFKETISDANEYVVSKDLNELSDFSTSIQELIKTTLEDNEYLTEPRNLSDKYILIYKFDTEYDIHGDSLNEQVNYSDLSAEDKAKYTVLAKDALLDSSVSSYTTTWKEKLLEESGIEIYDPFFETKFYYVYSDWYERLTSNVSSTFDLIFKLDSFEYSVEDFYLDASRKYASTIIPEYFILEYADKYYDSYVDNHYIDSDLHDDNVETLEDDIDSFNNNEKSQYPKSAGLEVYLLATYGYLTKDDVIKYYYDARQARTTYLSRNVFLEWGDDEHNVTDTAKTGFLTKLLETGNNQYSTLFDINLDHILINIDDDGDGSPDDPNKFLTDNPSIADEFKNAVEVLAKALYTESINEAYSGNSLYEILTYIKSEYELGNKLKSDPTKTWDDYKTFNFLLTVEQLSSSSDITESTVSNFVEPFANYVKNIYKFASATGSSSASSSYENGIYYFVFEDSEGELTGHTASTAEQVSYVTYDSLCMTNYGYHMIILNSYTTPRSTKSTKSSDSVGYLENIQVNLQTYTDDDDNEVVIYVTTDGYNEDYSDQASFEQFFIYYVQTENGASSSLESNIATLLGRMFSSVLTTYTSSNFQNYLLYKTLDIKISDFSVDAYRINDITITALINECENNLSSYGDKDTYDEWIIDSSDDLTIWVRPDKI